MFLRVKIPEKGSYLYKYWGDIVFRLYNLSNKIGKGELKIKKIRKGKLIELFENDKISTPNSYQYSNSYIIYHNIPWTIRGIDLTNEELIVFARDELVNNLAHDIQKEKDFIEKHRFDWFKETTGGKVY